MLSSFFSWLPWAIVAVYLVLCEIMDTKARLTQLEEDWPTAAKLVNNRAMRLVLLIVCVAFLGKDISNTVAVSSPPNVIIKPPPAPIFPSFAPVIPGRDSIASALLRFVNVQQSFIADANGNFGIPEFQLKNFGGRAAPSQVSARLYLSMRPNTLNGAWEPLNSSDEPNMPVELWTGGFAEISPGETWHTPPLAVQVQGGLKGPIQGKLRVFYGADKPAELDFSVEPPTPPALP
jgi:hypothetical protein